MGHDAHANIWFGFNPRDDYVAPWHGEEWEYEIDDWWAEGINKKDFGDDYDAKEKWLEENPCPITEVAIGSCGYQEYWYGLALTETHNETSMGVTVDVDVNSNRINDELLEEELLETCEKLGIEVPRQSIGWKLSAYYG